MKPFYKLFNGGPGSGRKPSGTILAHPQYTPTDYHHFSSKGWSDDEIKQRWDEEHAASKPPQNHSTPPDLMRYFRPIKNSGTSEGVKKGWESRLRGSMPDAKPHEVKMYHGLRESGDTHGDAITTIKGERLMSQYVGRGRNPQLVKNPPQMQGYGGVAKTGMGVSAKPIHPWASDALPSDH